MELKLRHIGDEVTEAQKQAFVEANTFFCGHLWCNISSRACEQIQKRSVNTIEWNPVLACQTCPQFSVEKKKQPKKICKLAEEYPGTCVGDGYFHRRETQTNHSWRRKRFCTQTCAVRYNHFISLGWDIVDDVGETYFEKGA